jgi:hypothetical protein
MSSQAMYSGAHIVPLRGIGSVLKWNLLMNFYPNVIILVTGNVLITLVKKILLRGIQLTHVQRYFGSIV